MWMLWEQSQDYIHPDNLCKFILDAGGLWLDNAPGQFSPHIYIITSLLLS